MKFNPDGTLTINSPVGSYPYTIKTDKAKQGIKYSNIKEGE